MPIPSTHPQDPPTQPTAPSPEEKAAMERAVAREGSSELFGRLERENTASRPGSIPSAAAFARTDMASAAPVHADASLASSSLDAVTARLQRVNAYNRLASAPDAAMTELQRAFVYGRMPDQDAASFVQCRAHLMGGLAASRRP